MPLLSQTFRGAPGGMNVSAPAQEIEDDEARYLQDVLVDRPGVIRRRGPLTSYPNSVQTTSKGVGLAECIDPAGTFRIGVFNGANFSVYASDYASKTDLPWNGTFSTAPYPVVDAKVALGGGSLLGTSSQYENGGTQTLALWGGGNKVDYSTGSLSVALGGTTVTGSGTSWSTNIVPGMFLFAIADSGTASQPTASTTVYLGFVNSVDSNTQITLGAPAPFACTGKTYTIKSFRGIAPKVMKGTITCATTSTTVSGGKTKFIDQGLNSGQWFVYRQSDLTFIGKVSSVTSNIALSLAANAAINMAGEKFVAVQADADYTISTATGSKKLGFLTATFAGRQWYANLGQSFEKTQRLWYSDPNDLEGLDLSYGGDYLNVISSTGLSSPIKALCPTYNSLLVFKENEVFAISGSSSTSFTQRKLSDDGAESGMSVQPYGGGAIWAGRDGIYFYDGTQVQNITEDSLGYYWREAVRFVSPQTYRMWSMISRDHYFLHVENCAPPVAVIKGNVSSTPSRITVVINLLTEAVSLFTNINIRGFVDPPASSTLEPLFLVNTSTAGILCTSSNLFDGTGADAVACDGGTAGPDFYLESKRFDFGAAMQKKYIKQVALEYESAGDSILADAVPGLNSPGRYVATLPPLAYTWTTYKATFATWTAGKTTYPTWASINLSLFKPRRFLIQKRDQFMGFRLYQNSSAVTDFTMGPYKIEFKPMREGRVV